MWIRWTLLSVVRERPLNLITHLLTQIINISNVGTTVVQANNKKSKLCIIGSLWRAGRVPHKGTVTEIISVPLQMYL